MASENADRSSTRLSSFSVYDDPPVTNAGLIKRQLELELQLKSIIEQLIKAYLDTDSLDRIEELTEHQLCCCGRISAHRLQLLRLKRSQTSLDDQCDVEDPVELPQDLLQLLADSAMDSTVEEVITSSDGGMETQLLNHEVADSQLNGINDLLTDDAIDAELTELIESVVNKAIKNAAMQLVEQNNMATLPDTLPPSSIDKENDEEKRDVAEVTTIAENESNNDRVTETNVTASLNMHPPSAVNVCDEGNGEIEKDITEEMTVESKLTDHVNATKDEASKEVTDNSQITSSEDDTPPNFIKEVNAKHEEFPPEPQTGAQDVADAAEPVTEEPVATENTSVQSEHIKNDEEVIKETELPKEDPVGTELTSDPVNKPATECANDDRNLPKNENLPSSTSTDDIIQSSDSPVVKDPIKGSPMPIDDEKLVKSVNSSSPLAKTVPQSDNESSKKPFVHMQSSPVLNKVKPKSSTLDFRTTSINQKSKTLGRAMPDLSASAHVTPLGAMSTFEWDPTSLLEELYIDCKPVSPPGVQTSRLIVEMEKLPRNQVKKTIAKGWKKRFFCITSGNLYYYEDKKMAKALGVVKLSGAKVVCEDSVIKVTDKMNQTIVIRGKPEDTYRMHRSLHLESVHPTLTSVLSPYPGSGHPTVIVDIGSCSVRAGFAQGEAYPRLFFPAVCSVVKDTDEIRSCGFDALTPFARKNCEIVFPTRQKLRMDQETSVPIRYIHFFLLHIFKELKVEPSSAKVIMTLPQNYTEKDKELIMEMLLENLSCEAACLLEQSILSLYSYGVTSGIVVDIGDRTDIVPIVDGYKIESGITKVKIGGATVTDYLKRLSTEHGLRYFSDVEFYITRLIKEKIGFVSQDFGSDMERCEADAASYIRALEVAQYQLPDRKTLIAMDSPLFRSLEGFFLPSLWGKDIPSIPDSILKAIQACDIDRRKEMSRSIYLSGGATLATGFQERLERELSAIAPSSYTIQVQASVSRHHAAFLGAAILASLDSFQDSWITKEDFIRLKM